MLILIRLLFAFEIIVCFLLAGVIMLQKPKEGGLNVAIGGGMGESLFGAQMGNVLVRATIILGAIFLLNTVVLSRLTSNVATSIMEGVRTPAPVAQQQEALPFTGGESGLPASEPVKPIAP